MEFLKSLGKKALIFIGYIVFVAIIYGVTGYNDNILLGCLVTPVFLFMAKRLYALSKTTTSVVKKYICYGCIFLVVVLIVGVFTGTIEKSQKNQETSKAQQTASQNITPMTDEQYSEMGKSYNALLSNKYPGLYEGCMLSRDGHHLVIEVNSMWFKLHEEDKKAFIKQNGTLYNGMLGARSININLDHFEIEVRHKGSSSVLATWDSLRGPKIKK